MIQVRLHSIRNATPQGEAFAHQAAALLQEVVNAPAFLQRVRAGRYSSTWRTLDQGGYARASNDEVVRIISTGKEFREPANDFIDLTVVLERLASGSVGVVYPPDPLITTNTLFFDEWMAEGDPLSLAAHWMHEWMHVAGFYHPWLRKTRDVSYRVGDFVVAVGRELAGPELMKAAADDLEPGFLYLKAAHEDACPVHIPGAPDDGLDPDARFGLVPGIAAAAAPDVFAIDVHAHTFNASDLSVEGFLANVIVDSDEHGLLRLVDPLVRMLARVIGRAPGAEEEIRRLDAIQAGSRGRMAAAFMAADEDEAAARGVELETRVAAEVERLSRSSDLGEMELFEALAMESAPDVMRAAAQGEGVAADLPGRIVRGIFSVPGTIGRYVRWVARLRGYRHQLIAELVRTYGEERGSVRLFTPSMVDFARWVDDEPATPLDAQVTLGGRLSRAFPGRVHFMAAFDPWREADHPGATSGSLYWVRRAVEDYGFVGVKLYPPMGFSAIGNEAHDFRPVGQPDGRAFGRRLDDALEGLFAWAEAEEVPLLAHCNESLGSKRDFALRASPDYWRRALEKHPELRLNLGHFGGQEKLGVPGEWPEKIIGLMGDFPHVYADIGMFHLRGARERADWFDRLARAVGDTPVLAQRLLYGSDWIMLAKEKGAADFFIIFANELHRRFAPEVARDILGGNAVRYLGLHAGGKAVARLKAFYGAHGIPEPDWLASA